MLNASVMLQKIGTYDTDVKHIWFLYEAYISIDGFVNKHNWRIWGTDNPHVSVRFVVASTKVHGLGQYFIQRTRWKVSIVLANIVYDSLNPFPSHKQWQQKYLDMNCYSFSAASPWNSVHSKCCAEKPQRMMVHLKRFPAT